MKPNLLITRIGRGHASPEEIRIFRKNLGWLLPCKEKLCYRDSDAIPFMLYDNGEEPSFIAGGATGARTLEELREKAAYAKGIAKTYLEGTLWRDRHIIVFKDNVQKVEHLCLLEDCFKSYEDIDICDTVIYSQYQDSVYYTTLKNLYAEEKFHNKQAAARVIMHEDGYCDETTAEHFIDTIVHELPMISMRCFRFLPFAAKWVYGEEKPMDLVRLAVSILGQKPLMDTDLFYLTFDELLERLLPEISRHITRKKTELEAVSFENNANRYSIIPVPTYDIASAFSHYTDWCITKSPEDFHYYTKEGQTFYFCLEKDYEHKERCCSGGKGINEYGLSMLAVSVNRFGLLAEVTNRWNDTPVPRFDEKSLSKLLGVNFFSTMIPFRTPLPDKDISHPSPVSESADHFKAQDSKADNPMISSGLHSLERTVSRWRQGELVLIGGRYHSGKTSLALTIANLLSIQNNIPTAFFSLELSNVKVVNRLIQNICEIPGLKIREGTLNNREWDILKSKLSLIQRAPCHFDDTPDYDLSEFRQKVRKIVKEHGVRVVIVDYLQLMHSSFRFQNRKDEMRIITRMLKELAREQDVVFIVFSQLNSSSNTRPQISDFMDADIINQYADKICFIHCPVSETETKEYNRSSRLAEFIIAKFNTEQQETIRLGFCPEIGKFTD